MGTKTALAVSSANIFMSHIETQPDIVTLISSKKQTYIILLLNSPPKFTETMFLDTVVYKGTRLNENAIRDVKTTETFQRTFCPLSLTDLSKELRKVFQNSKERLMFDDGQRLPTQFERKIAIRNK